MSSFEAKAEFYGNFRPFLKHKIAEEEEKRRYMAEETDTRTIETKDYIYKLTRDKTYEKELDAKTKEVIRKLSLREEKFYRYCFNLDIENVKKYRQKCQETYLEVLEDMMESPQSYLLMSETYGEPENTIVSRKEGAVIKMGQIAKEWTLWSEKMVHNVEQFACVILG